MSLPGHSEACVPRADEPSFVLLGRDPEAGRLVELWAHRRRIRVPDDDKIAGAEDIAAAMHDYRRAHRGEEKLREELPLRRTGGSIDFHWQSSTIVYTVGFSLYPKSWRCAEVFLNVSKSEGMAEANARDAGILASFALQHGARLDDLVAAVTHEADGSASSIVGTALNLVQSEIARLKRGDAGDAASPSVSPDQGRGDGGVSIAAAVPEPAAPAPETAAEATS